jgi:hypothetical protein
MLSRPLHRMTTMPDDVRHAFALPIEDLLGQSSTLGASEDFTHVAPETCLSRS